MQKIDGDKLINAINSKIAKIEAEADIFFKDYGYCIQYSQKMYKIKNYNFIVRMIESGEFDA